MLPHVTPVTPVLPRWPGGIQRPTELCVQPMPLYTELMLPNPGKLSPSCKRWGIDFESLVMETTWKHCDKTPEILFFYAMSPIVCANMCKYTTDWGVACCLQEHQQLARDLAPSNAESLLKIDLSWFWHTLCKPAKHIATTEVVP